MTSIRRFLFSPPFQTGIILLGVFLRLQHYLEHCSIWLDESWVAVEIVGRSISAILRAFPYNPPLGFSLAEKLAVLSLGNDEYALRIFPLLASIAALILFYGLVRKYLEPAAAFLALAFLAFCEPLIYQAAQIKQYSSDVCMALVLYRLVEYVKKKNFAPWPMRWLGIVGATALWISNSCVFILAGIASTWIVNFSRRKEWRKLKTFSLALLFWIWSFAVLYQISLGRVTRNEELLVMWKEGFPANSIFSSEGWIWFKNAFVLLFQDPGGFPCPVFPATIFVIGCLALFQKDRERLALLTVPIVLMILAAVFHKYPFKGRVLFFTVPAVMILVAQGVQFVLEKIQKIKASGAIVSLIEMVVIVIILLPVLKNSWQFHHCHYNSRAAIQYLQENYRPGDKLFFNSGALYPFWYYVSSLNFSDRIPKEKSLLKSGISGEGMVAGKFYDSLQSADGNPYAGFEYQTHFYDEKGYFQTAEALTETYKIFKNAAFDFGIKGRVWITLLHISPEVHQLILQVLDRQGKRLTQFEKEGAYVYLYDLGNSTDR